MHKGCRGLFTIDEIILSDYLAIYQAQDQSVPQKGSVFLHQIAGQRRTALQRFMEDTQLGIQACRLYCREHLIGQWRIPKRTRLRLLLAASFFAGAKSILNCSRRDSTYVHRIDCPSEQTDRHFSTIIIIVEIALEL